MCSASGLISEIQVLGSLLGKGSYGRVYKGLNLKTGQFVAIKEMRMGDCLGTNDVSSVMVRPRW